jgi:hypothetical protein
LVENRRWSDFVVWNIGRVRLQADRDQGPLISAGLFLVLRANIANPAAAQSEWSLGDSRESLVDGLSGRLSSVVVAGRWSWSLSFVVRR